MKNFIKKSIMMIIIGIISICMLSAKLVFADIIDLSDSDGFSIIGDSDNSSQNDNTEKSTTSETESNINKDNNVSNSDLEKSSSKSNESVLPATGSNAEIIFIASMIVLIGIAVFVYKKSKIKLD